MKPLPDAVKALFCASNHPNTYKRAIQELVYNALDAQATSIAIRLDFPENRIQVIDNGYGVTKNDMNNIGKRYMTSKTTDLDSLKSVPNCYGFRGQSLASLIEISRVVKITSRVDALSETLLKTFCNGKEKSIKNTATRPSKGTTVEIQGYLYNLTIQKKTVSPLTELQETKHFLRHLSLVHNNVSISLRDNTNNDIVFQIHKCRDIYQTFSTLFNLERGYIQELQVEKKLYKVTAYIGKRLGDGSENHWVYLNQKFIPWSRLQKILDTKIAQSLGMRNQARRKVKTENGFLDNEKGIFKTNIPFYFVFITCPYNDYDINESSKTLELEFKDWDNITELLEKLVKLYAGDKNFNETKKTAVTAEAAGDTRDEVKKIMEKILASTSRRPGVSQMQNGIKGKLVKRKKKKVKDISLSEVLPHSDDKAGKDTFPRQLEPQTPMSFKDPNGHSGCMEEARAAPTITNTNSNSKSKESTHAKNRTKQNTFRTKPNGTGVNVLIKKENLITKFNRIQKQKETETPKRKKLNILAKIFQEKPSIVKQRCRLLAKKVDKLRQMKNIHKRKITYNELSQYSSIQTKNQKITVKKRVGEIIIHESIPFPSNFHHRKHKSNLIHEIVNKDKQYRSSYDLLQTILKTQQNVASQLHSKHPNMKPSTWCENPENNYRAKHHFTGIQQDRVDEDIENEKFPIPSTNLTLEEQKLTYESHACYKKHRDENTRLESYKSEKQRYENRRFITSHSKDNFTVPNNNLRHRTKFKPHKRNYANYFRKLTMLRNLQNFKEHSYTIEFSQTNKNSTSSFFLENSELITNPFEISHLAENVLDKNMYTINREDEHMNAMTNLLLNGTYTINRMSIEPQGTDERLIDSVDIYQRDESYYNKEANTIEDSVLNSKKGTNTADYGYVLPHRTYYMENNAENFDKSALPKKIEAEPDVNIIFVSKSQEHAKSQHSSEAEQIDPLDICETVLNSYELFNGDFDHTINHRDIVREEILYENNVIDDHMFSMPSDAMATYNAVEETSHHFNEIDTRDFSSLSPGQAKPVIDTMSPKLPTDIPRPINQITAGDLKRFRKDGQDFHLDKDTGMTIRNSVTKDVEGFGFSVRNRPRYIPKGMSPIFANCNTKTACNYELDEDYFGDSMYNEFAKTVNANAEVYEANVESVNNLATKEINRFNERLKKDNASLCFQGGHLRDAKVLGQADSKFIAAKLLGTSGRTETTQEYLVLFDQHAVHERIRLENNLSEYLKNNQWKSVALDDVTIRLKPDEIIYLHNYKDKFQQLGLQWTIEGSDQVSITAIPEAIIGKNARQVDIIMKSVRSLILEEIEAIKFQKGSLCLYPKSIMELVFNEACRYAIKFGDRLTHSDCVRLLRDLSECKTPFQCAHGRPVMAVLMEIKPKFHMYRINMTKLKKFKKMIGN